MPASLDAVALRILDSLQEHAPHVAPQELKIFQGVLLDQSIDHGSIVVGLLVLLLEDAALDDAIGQLVHILLEEHEGGVEVFRILVAVLGGEALLHVYKLRCQASGQLKVIQHAFKVVVLDACRLHCVVTHVDEHFHIGL